MAKSSAVVQTVLCPASPPATRWNQGRLASRQGDEDLVHGAGAALGVSLPQRSDALVPRTEFLFGERGHRPVIVEQAADDATGQRVIVADHAWSSSSALRAAPALRMMR